MTDITDTVSGGPHPAGAPPVLAAEIAALNLVDHHAHSVFRDDVDHTGLEAALSEAPTAPEPPWTRFDSQLGFAVRRHCAPLLDLPPFAAPEAYSARRAELGVVEVTARLTRTAGIGDHLLDGGHAAQRLLSDEEFARVSGARVHRVVRLESVAERVMRDAASPEGFLDSLAAALEARRATCVGYKSIAAYRCGLLLDPAEPDDEKVAGAARAWFAEVRTTGECRLRDPVLIRHLIWWALERRAPLQLHTGFGDPDLRLLDANPLHLQPLIDRSRPTGGRVLLLHCYPYEREAGYLAHAYPHVYLDVGLAAHHLGANADSAVRHSLELAPFHKVLFSTDAWGLPELTYLGALMWRRALGRVLGRHITDGEWRAEDAVRVARMIGRDNALRVYGLDRNA
ncbi:amidohydrolase family protein [Streptomyces hebeiensis]